VEAIDIPWGLPRWVEVMGLRFLVRPLTRREYRQLAAAAPDELAFEDEIVRLCCLDYPRNAPEVPLASDGSMDLDRTLAGIVSSIARIVLDQSGFGASRAAAALVRRATGWASTEEGRFDSLICAALKLTPSDVENLPGDEYMRCLAVSHLIAAAFFGIPHDALQEYLSGSAAQGSSDESSRGSRGRRAERAKRGAVGFGSV